MNEDNLLVLVSSHSLNQESTCEVFKMIINLPISYSIMEGRRGVITKYKLEIEEIAFNVGPKFMKLRKGN